MTLSNVKVKSTGLFGQVTLADTTNATIVMGSKVSGAVGTCFASVTGVMNLETSDSPNLVKVRTVNPRTAADLVAGTTTGS